MCCVFIVFTLFYVAHSFHFITFKTKNLKLEQKSHFFCCGAVVSSEEQKTQQERWDNYYWFLPMYVHLCFIHTITDRNLIKNRNTNTVMHTFMLSQEVMTGCKKTKTKHNIFVSNAANSEFIYLLIRKHRLFFIFVRYINLSLPLSPSPISFNWQYKVCFGSCDLGTVICDTIKGFDFVKYRLLKNSQSHLQEQREEETQGEHSDPSNIKRSQFSILC